LTHASDEVKYVHVVDGVMGRLDGVPQVFDVSSGTGTRVALGSGVAGDGVGVDGAEVSEARGVGCGVSAGGKVGEIDGASVARVVDAGAGVGDEREPPW
jgi:hypothetical protein